MKAEASKVTVAVATVVIFGTVAIFLYPAIYPLMSQWFSPETFGIYIGSTVLAKAPEAVCIIAIGFNGTVCSEIDNRVFLYVYPHGAVALNIDCQVCRRKTRSTIGIPATLYSSHASACAGNWSAGICGSSLPASTNAA